MTNMWPLDDYTVVDLSSGVTGAYCTHLLAGAGAVVVKVEPPEGDPLRRRCASGTESSGSVDGAIFQLLACSTQSVVADPARPADIALVLDVIAHADAVVWAPGTGLAAVPELLPAALHERFPELDILAVTQFGLDGPWAGRAATDFTLQAWAGAIDSRGLPSEPPVSADGWVAEWIAGTFAATALLASRRRRGHSPGGQILDTSILDAVALSAIDLNPVHYSAGADRRHVSTPTSMPPSIHATKDGWVGFMTGTGKQWLDFCVLVERIDWLDDDTLITQTERGRRRAELTAHIDSWAAARTTAEILDLAAKLRVPAAPVGNGPMVPGNDHLADLGLHVEDARGGFLQPAPPYRLTGKADLPALGRPPTLGEHTDAWSRRIADGLPTPAPVRRRGPGGRFPYDDLRVVELTAFWAGASAAQFLGIHGAEVIKVESPAGTYGMRASSPRAVDEEKRWEFGPLYHTTNTNKLSLGLRLDRPRGLDLLVDLLDRSDVLVENFSPRVLDPWGLDEELLHQTNPGLIVVRTPAFGLAGPWRSRTGPAQTIEQTSGTARDVGFPSVSPQIPSGICDPVAAAHAAFALQVALAVRDRTGEGLLVEVPMMTSDLDPATDEIVDHTAYGVLAKRLGNRPSSAALQNFYRSSDPDDGLGGPLVAVAVETDEQWAALVEVLGLPEWAQPAGPGGRKAQEELLDAELRQWCAQRPAHTIVELLWAAGVPVALAGTSHAPEPTQFDHRRFFESVEHPMQGPTNVAGVPVLFSKDRYPMHRRRAPMLGEHNHYIVTELLGMTADEYAGLQADQVIGRGFAA